MLKAVKKDNLKEDVLITGFLVQDFKKNFIKNRKIEMKRGLNVIKRKWSLKAKYLFRQSTVFASLITILIPALVIWLSIIGNILN